MGHRHRPEAGQGRADEQHRYRGVEEDGAVGPLPSSGGGEGGPTQGARPRLRPYRTAAECIDWSIPCPSIFLTKEEGRAIGVKRPLADKTLRRIAAGVFRYVINEADPFIVPVTHTGPDGDDRTASIRKPLPTVTAIDHNSLVAAHVVRCAHGDEADGKPRWGKSSHGMREPIPTVTASKDFALATAFLSKFYGTAVGQDVREPMPTVTADGQHVAQVRAFLIKYYGQGVGQGAGEPLHTVTTKERFGLVTVAGVEYEIVDIGLRMLTPRELARAQGFPDTYRLTGTKASQIARIGNSVCPVMAEALARANYTAPVHGAGRAVA